MRIALDAMGGDEAPAAAVRGAVLFAHEFPSHEIVLVGQEAPLRALLDAKGSPPPNVRIHPASETVGMGESASAAIRSKRDSSMRVALELVREGKAQAMVSAGHSGAMLAGALLVLGRLPEVERPAIAALLPGPVGSTEWLLLDAGANVQVRPSQLLQFAVMGEAYLRRRLGVARPRVALLSNGEEETKGTDITREALELLRRSDLEVTGYIEGKDLFAGLADVVVTDGFTGNAVLKTSEGTASAILERVRVEVAAAPLWQRFGAWLLRPALQRIRHVADYAEYGGAPLLGVGGVAIVAHGRSTPKAFKNALRAALETAEGGFVEDESARLVAAKAWLEA